VLLYVWLVTPLRSPSVWPLLELPFAKTGRKEPGRERDVWVSVRANGEIFVDEQKVAVPVLPADPDRNVFVRVDRAAPFGAVRTLVRAAQRSNRRTLTFMARRSPGAEFVLPAPLSCTEPGISPPVVIKKVIPELGDLRGPEPGPAILELSIDRSGRVTSVRVIRGTAPAIDAKLIDAASNWRFQPATQFGKPVDCVFPVSVLIDVR
jgi:TonB family protein